MKNVLFIMRYYIDSKKDNLYTKFSGQIMAVKKLGYNVWYTGCTEDEIFICNEDKKIRIAKIPKTHMKILNKIYFYNSLYKSVIIFLKQSDLYFDFVYARNMFYCNNSVKLLKELKKKNFKIVMEVPTYPVKNEIKENGNYVIKYLMLNIHEMSKRHAKYVDLYTVIGENCNYQYFGVKAINMENGVEVENIPKKTLNSIDNEIHILTLASMAKWHGYDRLIVGLNNYYKKGGKEKIYIHIVGNDGDGSLQQWRKMTNNLKLNNNIIFEGYKTGDDLCNIINKCDIAMSSLAGYRIKIFSTSEMKSREYMARGIPFIYATNDAILQQAPEYCCKVRNDGSPICIETIIEFTKKTRNNTNIINEMRCFAKNNMSWEKQFVKVIKLINE